MCVWGGYLNTLVIKKRNDKKKMKKKRGKKLKKQNILVEKNLGKKNVLDFFPQNFFWGGRIIPPPL